MDTLTLETRSQINKTTYVGGAALAPITDEDYWSYRVMLSDTQAIVGFPKYGTVGIGFAQEEHWNSNLPYTSDTEKIFQHIRENKGDDSITDDACRAAIRVVQEAAKADRSAR